LSKIKNDFKILFSSNYKTTTSYNEWSTGLGGVPL